MAEPRPKNPVTPLPMPPAMRAAYYAEADGLGRKLTTHLLRVLQEHLDAAKKRK